MSWIEPDPITWKGYWPDDTAEDRAEREPWETYELAAIGREAGDMRVVTLADLQDVFRQNPDLFDAYRQGVIDGKNEGFHLGYKIGYRDASLKVPDPASSNSVIAEVFNQVGESE